MEDIVVYNKRVLTSIGVLGKKNEKNEKNQKKKCTFILTSGKNKGNSCVSNVKKDSNKDFCSRHSEKAISIAANIVDYEEPKILRRIKLNGKDLITDGEFLYEEKDNEGVYVGRVN
jgi:hypothetical protein